MKTINKVLDKLNKLPVWVGYVTVIVVSVVAAIPSVMVSEVYFNAYAKEISAILGQSISIVVYDWQKALLAFGSGFVAWGVLEFIIWVVLSWMQRSRRIVRDVKSFKSTARYCYTIYELIVGLGSLTSIWNTLACNYYIGILEFIVKTVIFTLGYLYVKDRCLDPNFVFNAYNGLFMVHFIYYGAYSTLNVVSDIIDTSTEVGVIVSDAVMLAVVIAGCIALYFTVYKKLQEEQKENRKRILPPDFDQGNGPDEIFRGYGM